MKGVNQVFISVHVFLLDVRWSQQSSPEPLPPLDPRPVLLRSPLMSPLPEIQQPVRATSCNTCNKQSYQKVQSCKIHTKLKLYTLDIRILVQKTIECFSDLLTIKKVPSVNKTLFMYNVSEKATNAIFNFSP